MRVNDLKSVKSKSKKRVGRGGKAGTYSGKGMKGQKSRSGYSRRATWEGGRTTLVAATKKKRGFKSRNPKNQIVSLDVLNKHFKDGDEVSPQILMKKGLINSLGVPVKILNNGKFAKSIKLKDILVSRAAEKNIKKI